MLATKVSNNDLVIVLGFVALGVAGGGLLVAFITLPRWLMRSLHRHRLWRFRDHVAFEILDGTLPSHAASWALLNSIEASIECDHRISVLRVWLFRPTYKRLSSEARERVLRRFEPALGTLTGGERKLISDRRERLSVLRTGSALLGSWIGLALVLSALPRVVPQVVADVRSARRASPPADSSPSTVPQAVFKIEADTATRAVVRKATDTAAVRSRLGQLVSSTIDELSPRVRTRRPQLAGVSGLPS